MGWREEYPLDPFPQESGERKDRLEERSVPGTATGDALVLGVRDWLFGVNLESGEIDAKHLKKRIDFLAPAEDALYLASGLTVVDMVDGTGTKAEYGIRDITVHNGDVLATSGDHIFDPFTDEIVAEHGGDALASFDGTLYHATGGYAVQDTEECGIYESVTGEPVVEDVRVKDLTAGSQLYSVEVAGGQGTGRAVNITLKDRELCCSPRGGDVRVAETSEGVYASRGNALYAVEDGSAFEDKVYSLPNQVDAIAAVPLEVYDAVFDAA